MDTIFTIKNKDFEILSPQEVVDFFRELLWAEAGTLGVGLLAIPAGILATDFAGKFKNTWKRAFCPYCGKDMTAPPKKSSNSG